MESNNEDPELTELLKEFNELYFNSTEVGTENGVILSCILMLV